MSTTSTKTRTAKRSSSIATPTLSKPTSLSHSLPDPEALARYEKVIPGSAARILALAERQADQALRLRKITTAGKLLLVFAAGLLGGILLLTGSELAGLMIVLADILACAWAKSANHNQNA